MSQVLSAECVVSSRQNNASGSTPRNAKTPDTACIEMRQTDRMDRFRHVP